MTDRVFISIGSNLGDRVLNCREAIGRLGAAAGVGLIGESSLYETKPWGPVEQGPFINCALEITTRLGPRALFKLLKEMELDMGRTRTVPNGPREIDLDILFYGEAAVEEADLVIPHPRLHLRAFVLVPLAEIAPGFIHPGLGKSIAELASEVEEGAGVNRFSVVSTVDCCSQSPANRPR